MDAREDSGKWSDCSVSFWPFPNSSGFWRLISSPFLTRTSCRKTAHANGYYGAWSGWVVAKRKEFDLFADPLIIQEYVIGNILNVCSTLKLPILTGSSQISFKVERWRRKWQPTPVFLSGKSHGQRSLVGYSSWSRKELDMTEWLSTE